jgi:Zn-dependent metalloprotease
MCDIRNPLNCIIPHHMLEKMVENGSPKVKKAAMMAIHKANMLRMNRALVNDGHASVNAMVKPGKEEYTPELFRRVYDAKHGESLPGQLVRQEGDPSTADVAVDEAYDGAGATYNLYKEEYGRESIDNQGMAIDQTVHYDEDYNNAFWNSEQMVYGDGDEEIFTRFTIDIDVIAHELTHGITQYEAALRYWYQSGALNESFSDVFGSLIKQQQLHQEAKDADWMVGQKVLIGDEYALRSMKAPGTAYVNHPVLGTDPQPATMDDYLTLQPWEDNGGVHINSGIPNYAFYLLAMDLGGYAWKKAGLIWYRTLCEKLNKDSNFKKAALATIKVAQEEFGWNSLEVKAVTKAWKTVKVL